MFLGRSLIGLPFTTGPMVVEVRLLLREYQGLLLVTELLVFFGTTFILAILRATFEETEVEEDWDVVEVEDAEGDDTGLSFLLLSSSDPNNSFLGEVNILIVKNRFM